jgi:hypothetical protein
VAIRTVWRQAVLALFALALGVGSTAMAHAAATTPEEALRCCGSGEAEQASQAVGAAIACSVLLAAAALVLLMRLAGRLRGPGVLVALWNLLGLALVAYSLYGMVWLGMRL